MALREEGEEGEDAMFSLSPSTIPGRGGLTFCAFFREASYLDHQSMTFSADSSAMVLFLLLVDLREGFLGSC